ncbi:hypothetical protein DPMN_004586 [Dreissena polymorpha]|uniref:Uncharacterized protein n=1 Tax=Dreissena polymorpha TaxID=45954 RepID=A0A9D4RVQ9_DREPO|nr:hypothetical protein DPMN_004586 [Dreissena polymorpha]
MLLPFLFASNRTTYCRFMTIIQLKMNRLPEQLIENIAEGQFVAKVTTGLFNAGWIYCILEVTGNKALKSAGGIIGLTHNEGAIAQWFLSRPITAKYAMSFANSGRVGSEQHHTDTEYHTKSYNNAVQQMLSLYENEIFIRPIFSFLTPRKTGEYGYKC